MNTNNVKIVTTKKILTDKEMLNLAGKLWKNHYGIQIFNQSVDVLLPNGKYLARFRLTI